MFSADVSRVVLDCLSSTIITKKNKSGEPTRIIPYSLVSSVGELDDMIAIFPGFLSNPAKHFESAACEQNDEIMIEIFKRVKAPIRRSVKLCCEFLCPDALRWALDNLEVDIKPEIMLEIVEETCFEKNIDNDRRFRCFEALVDKYDEYLTLWFKTTGCFSYMYHAKDRRVFRLLTERVGLVVNEARFVQLLSDFDDDASDIYTILRYGRLDFTWLDKFRQMDDDSLMAICECIARCSNLVYKMGN